MAKQRSQQAVQGKNSINDTYVMPHSPEAEKATIGALLSEKTAIYEVMDFLKPDMFYDEHLNEIYSVILEIESHSDVDLITVSEGLKKRKSKVEVYQLAELSDITTSAIHIKTHAMIVFQDYMRRMLMMKCAQTLNDSKDMSVDVDDLISNHIYEVENLSDITDVGVTISIDKLAVEAYKEYQEREKRAKEGHPVGIHTGLKKLDNVLHGFQKGCVYVLAARPGMGKTAFLLNCARKTAEKGNNVLIFSLEMPKVALMNRMAIAHSGINSEAFKEGRLSQEEYISLAESLEQLSQLPISINDTASISVQQIRSQAKKMKRKGKCDLIMIDYLQLIDMHQLKGKTTNDEVSACSRAIKIMAKDLNVPVILLSQLNRSVESRADKVPLLSDLRDSGAIEQDADAVLFIHRPSYYDDNADRNLGQIMIEKNREGRTGNIDFWVDDCITNFKDEAPSGSYSNSYKSHYEVEEETPF
ncbi:replicative DNA helicase [Lascolabacillus massiliensis]|uniref:replicative DNA helicase n=1 Tax=Lascolabacillus massiliensis TaxID=1627894 RepID=UPI0009E89DFF|nr:replicative DNA helicase [Lascolabacillus massiliensis]